MLPRSRFTKPDSQTYLTPAFADLVSNVVVNGPFHPFVPCADAALQPREYLIREPIVVDAPLDCVWCADNPPCDYTRSKGNRGRVCLASSNNMRRHIFFWQSLPLDCYRADLSSMLALLVRHSLHYHSLASDNYDVASDDKFCAISGASILESRVNASLRHLTMLYPSSHADCS